MKSKWLAALTTIVLVAATPGWAASEKAKGGGQGAQKKAKAPQTEQVEDTADADSSVPETLRHRDRAQAGQDAADRDWDKERERHEDRDGDKDRDTDQERDRGRDLDEDRNVARGNETSQEMQRRKEERKEIKADYKEARKAGEVDASGKKPWWKFWEGDEVEATPAEN
jgi:hypothetical protein